jgi:hypothetical protein
MGRRFGSVWIAVVVSLVAGCSAGEVASDPVSSVPPTTATKPSASLEPTTIDAELEATTSEEDPTQTTESEVTISEDTVPAGTQPKPRAPASLVTSTVQTALPYATSAPRQTVTPTTTVASATIPVATAPTTITRACPGEIRRQWDERVKPTFDNSKALVATMLDTARRVITSDAVARGAVGSESTRRALALLTTLQDENAAIPSTPTWSVACESNGYGDLAICVGVVITRTPSGRLKQLMDYALSLPAAEVANQAADLATQIDGELRDATMGCSGLT